MSESFKIQEDGQNLTPAMAVWTSWLRSGWNISKRNL